MGAGDKEFNGVKVFSATLARDREVLGETVTRWLQKHPERRIVDKVVTQGYDGEFHCIALSVFYWE